jgi:hypothetical protein
LTAIDSQPENGPRPLFQVIAAYDVWTASPQQNVTQFFRDTSVSLSSDLEKLRDTHQSTLISLATAKEQLQAQQRQLEDVKRMQLLGSAMGLAGAILVGFGVNYLTSEVPTPGWTMLVLGALLQMAAIGAQLIHKRE